MNEITSLSPTQLRRAADLQERIQSMQKELAQMLGGPALVTAAKPASGKRYISPAGKARIAAAARARWARVRAGKGSAQPKRKMSSAARARLSAIAKARWQKVRALGKARL